MITFSYLHWRDFRTKAQKVWNEPQKKKKKTQYRVKLRATRLNYHILFSFLHFVISSYALTKGKKSSELAVGGGRGSRRRREALDELKRRARPARQPGRAAPATRKSTLWMESGPFGPPWFEIKAHLRAAV